MGLGTVSSIKKRKIIFDGYTGGFYAESMVEAVQRRCEENSKLADVVNKAEETRYRNACKKIDAEKQLFLMKKETASYKHSVALVDYIAHRKVLEKFAKEREDNINLVNDIYGKYPPESLSNNKQEIIEAEKKEMSPIVQRRRKATRLLERRNILPEIDRTMSTEDLFIQLKQRKSRVHSRVHSPAKTLVHGTIKDMENPQSKLILPAITVTLKNTQDSEQKNGFSGSVNRKYVHYSVKLNYNSEKDILSPVFITDSKTAAHIT